jgi:hypothetical protein
LELLEPFLFFEKGRWASYSRFVLIEARRRIPAATMQHPREEWDRADLEADKY